MIKKIFSRALLGFPPGIAMGHIISFVGFLIYFAIFTIIFVVIWFIQYVFWKNKINKINSRVDGKQRTQSAYDL